MARNQLDMIDLVALIVLPIAAGIVLGVWQLGIGVFGGYDFSQPLWTVGGAEISVALIGTVAAIAWVIGTNEFDGSNYEQYELGLIGVALAAVPAYEFIPAVGAAVNAHDAIVLLVWLGIASVSTYIAYIE
jgi:hypothetical protein